MAPNSTSHKQLHEQFVSNLTGTTVHENYVLIALPIVMNACLSFWSTNFYQLGLADFKGNIAVHFLCVAVPFIVAVTMLSNYLQSIFAGFLVLAIVGFANSAFLSRNSKYRPRYRLSHHNPAGDSDTSTTIDASSNRSKSEYKSTNWLLIISQNRGLILFCSSVCILAVDMAIFPRRFAKTETYGHGAMDLGVGLFSVIMGVVGAGSAVVQIGSRRSLRSVGYLVALGLIRLMLVKALDYQEHRTEYGRHWNFFFTLAIVRIVSIAIGDLSKRPRALVGLTVGTVLLQYWALHWLKLEALCNSDLESNTSSNETATVFNGGFLAFFGELVLANRQGLISLLGYVLLWLIGSLIGLAVARGRVGVMVALLCSIIFIDMGVHHWDLLSVSRRSANLGYVLWAAASFSCMQLLFLVGNVAQNWLEDRANYVTVTHHPDLLSVVNSRAMFHFLLANVLTGLVNISVATKELAPVPSLLVLTVYCGITIAAVHFVNKRDQL